MIYVDRESTVPLHEQIYRQLRQAILTGALAPGTKLISTRNLADELDVARIVVVEAYERLLAEGYTQTRSGSGTYVMSNLAVSANQTHLRGAQGLPLAPLALATGEMPPLGEIFINQSDDVSFDFRPGQPALDEFPRAKWAKTLGEVIQQANSRQFNYGPAAGMPELRSVLNAYISRARGLPSAEERVVVTTGAAQAIDLLTRACITPGDLVIIEDPSSPMVHKAFIQAGARLMPIPVDEYGLCIDQLPTGSDAPRLVYVTPSHQFPTGGVLPLDRRLRLIAWAEEHKALIIEDDYDSEFRYEGAPIPAMAGLDQLGRVAYIGTFSKTFFPALRIGYAVLPEPLLRPFLHIKWQADRQTPAIEQLALAQWLDQGLFERHIRRMRRIYAERRDHFVAALQHHFGKTVVLKGVRCGLHLYVEFHLDLSEQDLVERARAVGVRVYPVKSHYLQPAPTTPGLLFGYGLLRSQQIRQGIALLAAAFQHRAH